MNIKIWGARGSLPTPLRADELKTTICQAIYDMTDIDTQNLDAVQTYVDSLPLFVQGTAGGNTVCVEMQLDDSVINATAQTATHSKTQGTTAEMTEGDSSGRSQDIWVIDAGSGLHSLGKALMDGQYGQHFVEGKGTAHLFISHPRWDHVQGFPFFQPAFVAGNRIVIYSVHDLEQGFRSPQMFNVPIALDEMAATLEFVRLQEDQPLD